MKNPLDTLATHLAETDLAQEKTFVVGGRRRIRRLYLRAVVKAVIVLAAVAVIAFVADLDGRLELAAFVVLCWVCGRAVMHNVMRARAYQGGWIDGRAQMVMSLAEAQRRGLAPKDWLIAEAERDGIMLLGDDRFGDGAE